MDKDTVFFVLGGEDNEMVEIKRVLDEVGVAWTQPEQQWGVILVNPDSLPTAAQGKSIVYVECRPMVDDGVALIIDHHGEDVDRPASLLQVLELLEITPNHRQEIIASIDANFLSKTINTWPEDKEMILRIWESGYKKGFTRDKDYSFFKHQCEVLYNAAKLRLANGEDELLTIYGAPASNTLLAAMADLDGLDCILVKGSKDSDNSKPCFYQGNTHIVEMLYSHTFEKHYRGKYYMGCRAIPREFVLAVKNFLDQ